MSQTFSLVCKNSMQKIWVGQGNNEQMTAFYSGDREFVKRLKSFLNTTKGHSLEFICDDTDKSNEDFTEFGE